ncbi:AraC family transcriptional regulator [Chryseobacterium hagamense]|uniref:AraC family transcriptional regulator n=2 Tax=Chryseobacterium hagamense TaxID=395935 RepID=A0A511YJU9_9FLAO|nr:AraC family transcriptional regulator [Chryseobacterium hagamense]
MLMMTIPEFLAGIDPEQHSTNRFYTVLYFKKASGSITIDNRAHQLREDRIFFLNYNQVYHLDPETSASGFVMMFTKSFYNHLYTGNRLIKSETVLSDVPVFIDLKAGSKKEHAGAFEEILKEYRKNVLFSAEIICLHLKIYMLKYLRTASSGHAAPLLPDHKKETVQNFSELVNRHYKEHKTTAPYAEKLNLTANYLNSLVKTQLGISAGTLIKNRIILEAERLLLHTTLSVTEISYELGFTDNSHFGKYFKSVKGISPKSYRDHKHF